ncbi:MAG: class I SAM-dependent methyltransferase, partial [Alphaproteobacteria bacterium]|nr:class I SAM-dependent methyltransferase [Alphaproteobacteria bacterium]
MITDAQAKNKMDRMYCWTRHVYDLSRKYYLLGRDALIERLDVRPGEQVCEVGCGTARNLIKMAKAYPQGRFFGLDISDEMLKTARKSLAQNGLERSVRVVQGYSQSFDPAVLFGLEKPLDKIVFSYALSIIPPWRESLDKALDLLPSGGEIHIVDFGGQEGLSPAFRSILFRWLSLFHVYYKPEISDYLRAWAREGKGNLSFVP